MNTGISRTCRGEHQVAIKLELTANTSLPQDQREEISSAGMPMKQGDSASAEPRAHMSFQLPPEEISSVLLCTPSGYLLSCCLNGLIQMADHFKEISYLCLKCGRHVFCSSYQLNFFFCIGQVHVEKRIL